jgi:hypothetical protein
MAKFPRWRGLKNISSPTTIDYSEGQTFLDILKVFVFVQVELSLTFGSVRSALHCANPPAKFMPCSGYPNHGKDSHDAGS